MIPGAGLYLPETLHRSNVHALNEPTEGGRTAMQYERKKARSSQDTSLSTSKCSTDQNSITSEATTKVLDSTAIVFEYADYVFASSKRSAEAELFASLIWRTQQDLAEASRLYLSSIVTSFLEAWPDRKAWIDKILSEIRTALNDLGSDIESARSSREDDETLKMKRKFEYVMNYQKRLSSRQQNLTACHQSLSGAIQVMQTVEQCVGLGGPVQDPIFEAPVRPWLRSHSDIVRGPYSRRSSSKNLSVSSATDFEPRGPVGVLPEAFPVELPGSTPDDLKDSLAQISCTDHDAGESPQVNMEVFSHPVGNVTLGTGIKTVEVHTSQASSGNVPHHSDSGTTINHLDPRSHMSTNSSSSLNAMVDIIIERTQSIASTTASIRVPVLAKRYRPRPVQVQRPPTRHRSLPTNELPLYQSQTSLVDDLREWIVNTAASDQVTGINLTRSPTVTSTNGSIASRQEMTKMPATFPDVRENTETSVPKDNAVQTDSHALGDTISAEDCPLPPPELSSPPPLISEALHSEEDIALASRFPLPPSQTSSPHMMSTVLRQTEHRVTPRHISAITRKPLPSVSEDVTSAQSSPLTSPNPQHSDLFMDSGGTIPSSVKSSSMPSVHLQDHHSANTLPTGSPRPPQRPPPPPPTDAVDPLTIDEPEPNTLTRPVIVATTTKNTNARSPSEQDLAGQDLSSEGVTQHISPQPLPVASSPVTATPTQPQSPPPRPPKEPIVAEPSLCSPPQPQSPPPVPPMLTIEADVVNEQPKVRTAEAKRRAAHARRMKIAFG